MPGLKQSSLAAHLDLASGTCSKLCTAGVLNQRWSLTQNRIAYIRYLRDRRYDAGAEGDAFDSEFKIRDERARLAHHQANKVELETLELRGELVRIEKMTADYVDRILKAKAILLAIPHKTANVAIAATSLTEIREAVTREVDLALNELIRNDPEAEAALNEQARPRTATSDSAREVSQSA